MGWAPARGGTRPSDPIRQSRSFTLFRFPSNAWKAMAEPL